jgi:uncharacterized protein (TIGR02117 family)
MRRLAKWLGWLALADLVVFVASVIITTNPGDPALWPPAPNTLTTKIHVVSHGYHTGIVVPRLAARDRASLQNNRAVYELTQRFAAYTWLEIGWGDEGFYRMVPDFASVTLAEATRALFRPGNSSVVHVVGLAQTPRVSFANSDIVRIELSQAGFGRVLDGIDASFARAKNGAAIDDAGPGLYGPSRFYRGVGTFNIFNVCNHWVARLLSAAGLPTSPMLATMPQGLLLDLKVRAGLVPMPRTGERRPQ